jgi:hypothetical protein
MSKEDKYMKVFQITENNLGIEVGARSLEGIASMLYQNQYDPKIVDFLAHVLWPEGFDAK